MPSLPTNTWRVCLCLRSPAEIHRSRWWRSNCFHDKTNYFNRADKHSNSQIIMKILCVIKIAGCRSTSVSWCFDLSLQPLVPWSRNTCFFSFLYMSWINLSLFPFFFCNLVLYLAQQNYKCCSKFWERAELPGSSAPCMSLPALFIITESVTAKKSDIAAKHGGIWQSRAVFSVSAGWLSCPWASDQIFPAFVPALPGRPGLGLREGTWCSLPLHPPSVSAHAVQ